MENKKGVQRPDGPGDQVPVAQHVLPERLVSPIQPWQVQQRFVRVPATQYHHVQPPPQHQMTVPAHYDNRKPLSTVRYEKTQPKPKENNETKKTNGAGGGQLFRSPSAKRSPEAPVVMQGWLHKQGSEGLMLWRKRWFVLTEYCLFYYKGPEEEKLLGSVLLPSYKVSACSSTDKVFRKHAFKLEHTNMRTYVLAADSNELMLQWMEALSLACLLKWSGPEQQPKMNSSVTPTRIELVRYNRSPANHVEPQNWHNYSQPVYANAPPKPKRVVDIYATPDRMNTSRSPSQTDMYLGQNIYIPPPQNKHYHLHPYEQFTTQLNTERRTPDTYGRSKLTANRKTISDYEDVYADEAVYKRPLSPVMYSNIKKLSPARFTHRQEPVYREATGQTQETISRPHSADFLEYEAKHWPQAVNIRQQRSRPKSCLDINQGSSDSHHYSPENYAEKMRKSAVYLQNIPKKNAINDSYSGIVPSPVDMNLSVVQNCPPPVQYNVSKNWYPQSHRSHSVLSDGSFSKGSEVELSDYDKRGCYVESCESVEMKDYQLGNDSFVRSASARLIRPTGQPNEEPFREGDRKREESMKRLLEWKQRMLQSPLNRKLSSQIPVHHRSIPRKNMTGNPNSLVAMHHQYSSYSSDDEETVDDGSRNEKEPCGKPLQVGRTSHGCADVDATTQANNKAPDVDVSNENKTVVTLPEFEIARQENATTPLDTEVFKMEENYMTMTPKKSEFEPSSEKSELDENPYVEMAQGLGVIPILSDKKQNQDNSQQAYEIVCISEERIEPVYMELNQFSTGMKKNVLEDVLGKDDKQGLPDILVPSQSKIQCSKSDSSDADDEASKDLDSLDTPCHPRFSLSDTFRPASYYLGASRTCAEHHDSSDSELVSPPPIPTSPPPMDDIEGEYFKQCRDKRSSALSNSSKKSNTSNSECIFDKDCSKSTSLISTNLTKSRVSDNSDSEVELRNADYQYVSKRKPLSGEFFNQLFDSNDARSSIKSLDSFQPHDYENLCVISNSDNRSSDLNRNSSSCGVFLTPSPVDTCARSESSASVVTEIGCLINMYSSRSTLSCRVESSPPGMHQPKQYYYSAGSTLNNQRADPPGNKKDISRIVNPIKCQNRVTNSTQSFNEETDTFRLAAEARSLSVDFLNYTDKSDVVDEKNIYGPAIRKHLKSQPRFSNSLDHSDMYAAQSKKKGSAGDVWRTQSLEGLLDSTNENENANEQYVNATSEGSHLWEEDSLWRERLRRVSQRQTRSLDDLDNLDDKQTDDSEHSRNKISRGVKYVNDCVSKCSKTETTNKHSQFVIDRETLRQWDLLSSAPSDINQPGCRQSDKFEGSEIETEADANVARPKMDSQEQASSSVTVSTRETFPGIAPSRKTWTPPTPPDPSANFSGTHLMPRNNNQPQSEINWQKNVHNKGNTRWNDRTNVSAGELLGRTHEELVLLLIQLRRQNANISQSIETCYGQIDNLQSQILSMDTSKRAEHLKKFDQMKQYLLELEKQYEKGKPLINLVDNMVKLGSLYRNSGNNHYDWYVWERLKFNHQVEEKRLLAEEKRDWNRLSPSQAQLQEKVQKLYNLDSLIQEESHTLQCLQQDKEEIERALGNLKLRLNVAHDNPVELEQARKQQMMLENELSRVHCMLAQNSKKLEETVASNSRLEQELLVLRQKLQPSRQSRNSQQTAFGDSISYAVGASAMLESELHRVQQLVGDLQRQRQELSFQIKQLTDRSLNLQQQIQPPVIEMNHTQNYINKKRPQHTTWRETDLDTMCSIDHGTRWENTADSCSIQSSSDEVLQSISLAPAEKQEIKTVRIVKRESERRRDREKNHVGLSSSEVVSHPKWDMVVVEEDDTVLYKNDNKPERLSPTGRKQEVFSSSQEKLNLSDGSISSPVFKSEAARQIIHEMSGEKRGNQADAKSARRLVPKEKRRHYTAPHGNVGVAIFNELRLEVDESSRRARDDLDMERALRQRTDTPDVVRSTLGNKELKYNENTIDNILGTPNKIKIPERYVPEQTPQLSAEEQQYRLRKVESIKKMLSDSAVINMAPSLLASDNAGNEKSVAATSNKSTSKVTEEKRHREHLLQLNQILAKQVMEMSKIVAGSTTATEEQ